jgi:hypothetical protein
LYVHEGDLCILELQQSYSKIFTGGASLTIPTTGNGTV